MNNKKKILLIIIPALVLSCTLSAQKNEPVVVKAGTRVIDYFPFEDRYRYPQFVSGRIQFKSGVYSDTRLNYNFLMGEMEYIKVRDTLSIINKKDISYLTVARDTFYYDKGYLEQIYPGNVKLGLKEYIRMKEIQNKDSYGVSGSGSSTLSYNSLPVDGNFYKLAANKDMLFQKTQEYYISTPTSGFIQISRKNIMQLFPQKADIIKTYLKSNKVDFGSRDDLVRLVDYLKSL